MPHSQKICFRRRLTDALIGLGICIAAMPVAVILTITLLPLWRWLENTVNIESIGHSGPAEWCYLSIYIIVLFSAAAVWANLRKKQQRE